MLEVKRYADRADIFIEGVIDDEMARRLKYELNAIGDSLPLNIYINSAGGNVFSGVAMANMIAPHKGQTAAINSGLVASIATQIFFTADHCKAPENSFFLIHPPTTESAGNAADMRQTADVLEKISRGLQSTYRHKARGGVTDEQIAAMMEKETWLTASEAAELFIIEVVEPKQITNFAGLSVLEGQGIRVPAIIKNEIKKSADAIKLKKALDDAAAFIKTFTPERKDDEPMAETKINAETEKKLFNRAFNKTLLNPIRAGYEPLNDEEKRAFSNALVEGNPAKGGVLVSVEQINKLLEFRKAFVELKNFVNVVPALSSHGRMPTLPVQNLRFVAFDELTEITESDMNFGELVYTVVDRGLIIPASNDLLEDSDLDIIDIIGRQLARAAVTTENEKILQLINPLLTNATLATSWKSINRALYKDLDGSYLGNAKLFTNQEGFLWLCDLEDSQNRPLVTPDLAEPEKYLYRGHQVVVIPDNQLANITVGNNEFAPLFLGDFSSYLTFFERKGLELSASREYLWKRNGFALRAVIRFDVQVADPQAIIPLRIQL